MRFLRVNMNFAILMINGSDVRRPINVRIAVCDDMEVFSRHIYNVLSRWEERPANLIVETFDNADSLIAAHGKNPFDIILLDVIMPLLNGIVAAREIRQQDKNVKIVFLSTSPEFAVDSYTVKANNYLLKPLDPGKLYACMNELVDDLRGSPKTIVVKSIRAFHQIEVDKIEYVEAQNKRVLFFLCDGTTIEAVEPLYTYESQLTLDDGYFKCSRSYIVNIHHISTYGNKEVQMQSGCRITISRNRQKEFEAAYFETLFGKAGE